MNDASLIDTQEPIEARGQGGHQSNASVKANFARVPSTPEAQQLVEHIAECISLHEEATGALKKKRSLEQERAYIYAVGALAGDLAFASDLADPRLLAVPKASGSFTGKAIGYTLFKRAYDAFKALGWIEVVKKGSYQRLGPFSVNGAKGANPIIGKGQTERIRATPSFVALVRQFGIKEGTATTHFPNVAMPAPLELREGSKINWYGEKIKGRLLSLPKNDLTCEHLKAEIRELNEFIASFSIEPCEFVGWTRLFHKVDKDHFDWNQGGRLYAKPEGSYQRMPKGERAKLTINEEPTVEIDYRACFLTILYALRGQSLALHMRQYGDTGAWEEQDPYGIEGIPREVVKAWVSAALGAGKAPKKWPRRLAKEMKDEYQLNLKDYPVVVVGAAILIMHPVLLERDGISWPTLHWKESNVIVAIMLFLKRMYGIPSLPVHDSLIVPTPAWSEALHAMTRVFEELIGQPPLEPRLSVSRDHLPPPNMRPRSNSVEVEEDQPIECL